MAKNKIQTKFTEAKRDKNRFTNRSARALLRDLREHASKRNNLPGFETITRMIEQLDQGELYEDDLLISQMLTAVERFERGDATIQDLLIIYLSNLEHYEARVRRNELHSEVKRRRDLTTRFKVELERAARRRDGVTYLDLKNDKELLEQAPAFTRQIDQQTVDLATKALKLKAKHPSWTYARISTELTGAPSEAERIKKAVQRTRKAMKS